MMVSRSIRSMGLRYEEGRVLVLDQTLLPHEECWIESRNPDEMVALILRLAVRGAPLIGVAASLALAQFAESGATKEQMALASAGLRKARPTAVNLMTAVDRMTQAMQGSVEAVVREAVAIFEEDIALCEAMAVRGAEFIADGDGVLTHCNAGALATAGIGTALGVIQKAHEQGKRIHVYVDETRPLLQGARLTTWELRKLGIPHTLLCDNMAAFLMSKGKVQKIFVGADRIARNGDAANKIGTYGLAVSACYHGVPFYVVAPRTTFDETCASGDQIPIEERASEEVRSGRAPEGTEAWNPSFDVTPRSLITSIIFDDRVV